MPALLAYKMGLRLRHGWFHLMFPFIIVEKMKVDQSGLIGCINRVRAQINRKAAIPGASVVEEGTTVIILEGRKIPSDIFSEGIALQFQKNASGA